MSPRVLVVVVFVVGVVYGRWSLIRQPSGAFKVRDKMCGVADWCARGECRRCGVDDKG